MSPGIRQRPLESIEGPVADGRGVLVRADPGNASRVGQHARASPGVASAPVDQCGAGDQESGVHLRLWSRVHASVRRQDSSHASECPLRRDIPGELFEAMRVDGAGDWRTLTTLVLPLAKPALTTVAIYNGLNVWNGFIFPLVLTQSPDKRVLPLALWTFQGEFTANIPAVLAAVVLSTLPIVVLYIFGRRQLLAGLTAGVGK